MARGFSQNIVISVRLSLHHVYFQSSGVKFRVLGMDLICALTVSKVRDLGGPFTESLQLSRL